MENQEGMVRRLDVKFQDFMRAFYANETVQRAVEVVFENRMSRWAIDRTLGVLFRRWDRQWREEIGGEDHESVLAHKDMLSKED